jgi:hypothetical protein
VRTVPLVPAPDLRHVFDARIDVAEPWELGSTPVGQRRVIAILGGRIEGGDVSGVVLPGGADYQVIAPNGLTHLHARYCVQTDEGERIYVENVGLRFGPAEALERIRLGQAVDPSQIYFRTTPRFETTSPRLAWMTTTLFLATGARTPDQVLLSVFSA